MSSATQFLEDLEKRLEMEKTWVREVFKNSYRVYMDGKGGVGKFMTIIATVLAVRRDRETRLIPNTSADMQL